MAMSTIIYLFVALCILTGLILLSKGLGANRKNEASNELAQSDTGNRKCDKCGHLNAPDGDFCGRCGQTLNNEPEA